MPDYTVGAVVLLAGTVTIAAVSRVLLRPAVWLGLIIFAVLTVAADTILSRAGVYVHRPGLNAGIMIDRMPIEDLLYGIALYLVAAVSWSWDWKKGWFDELLRASRPFSWINTVLPFLAVGLWAQHRVTPTLVLGAIFFSAPYNLLLYGVNDIYDFESDRRNPRKGGVIEGGLIPPRHAALVWLTSATLAIPLIGIVGLLNPTAAAALLITAFVALAYSMPPLRLKEIPGLDALTASLAFVLPAACGAVVAGATWQRLPWLYLGAFLFWGIGSQALGAIQDVRYDRGANIRSIAAVLGARPTAWLATGSYLIGVGLVASAGGPSLLAAGALAPYALLSISCAVGDPDRWARRAWRGFLGLNLACGFVITMVLLHAGAVSILPEAP